jgi:hypothetical protein
VLGLRDGEEEFASKPLEEVGPSGYGLVCMPGLAPQSIVPDELCRVMGHQKGRGQIEQVAPEDVSHADIYRALGVLEGKLDALGQALTQRNMDFSTALNRITELEKTVAKGLGIALTCSVIIPLLVGAIASRVHIGQPLYQENQRLR